MKQYPPLFHRALLAFAIVIIVLIMLSIVGWISGGWDAPAAPQSEPALDYSVTSKYEPRLVELDRAALDHAYQNHVEHLFKIWMADATGQPARAVNGARTARRAYIGAMTEIEKRENVGR